MTTTFSKKKKEEKEKEMKQKILRGIIPYMVADSGASSSCGRPSNPFIKTGKLSTKKFQTPFGQVAQATKTAQLQHQVRPSQCSRHCLGPTAQHAIEYQQIF